MKSRGLGRGLDALLMQDEEVVQESLRPLLLSQLEPGRYQPRTRMSESALQDLADSIKAHGLIQPVLVRPLGSDRYEIIAGERRWRAAKLAGLSEVPALVREVPDEAALAMSLIENIQRENLNPLEEAQGLKRLTTEFGLTHEQVAHAVGRSRSAVTNLLRLTQLPPEIQNLVTEGELEMGHARALLVLPEAAQVYAANQVAYKRLSVRETEALVKRLLAEPLNAAARGTGPDPDISRLEERLAECLGAKVCIRHGAKGRGRVQIEYASLEELDGLLARFKLEET